MDDADGLGVGVVLAAAFVVDAGVVGVVAESVGSDVSVGSEVEVSVAVAVGVAVGVADGLVAVALGVVGVVVGLVEFGSGFGEVEVDEGDGLDGDGAAGSCTGSHDSPLDVVAVLAAAVLAATVRLAPEAASRTLPAISVTIAGRACVKRMKRLISAARRGMSPIGYRAPREAPSALLPGWPW